MQYYESMADLVGNTPLVRLTSVARDLAPTVLAKIEYLNPGGSVKDRIAVRMIEAAEKSGELRPGGTIVEPTSGNTGVGLAIVAQKRGYDCVFVLPGQGEPGQDQRAHGVRRPGRGLPDGGRPGGPAVVLLGQRPAGPRDRRRLEARPVLQPEQPAARTTRPPARSSGPRPTAGSPTSSPASAPAAPSAGPVATSRRSATAGCRSSAPTPRARCTPAAPAGRTSSRAWARTSGRRRTTRP